jgi:hypothetical protein
VFTPPPLLWTPPQLHRTRLPRNPIHRGPVPLCPPAQAAGGGGGRRSKSSDFLDFRNQWPMTRRRIRESWRNKPHLEKRPFRRVPADSRSFGTPLACCEAFRGELEAGTERDERTRFAASAHDRGGRRMSSSPSKRRTYTCAPLSRRTRERAQRARMPPPRRPPHTTWSRRCPRRRRVGHASWLCRPRQSIGHARAAVERRNSSMA